MRESCIFAEFSNMAIRKFIISQTTHGVVVQIEPLKFELFSYLRRKVERYNIITKKACCVVLSSYKASLSCSILCPFHLKRRMSANSCLGKKSLVMNAEFTKRPLLRK